MATKISIYLPEDIEAELEAIRRARPKIPSLSAIINEVIWDGLPADSKLKIRRARNGKSDD